MKKSLIGFPVQRGSLSHSKKGVCGACAVGSQSHSISNHEVERKQKGEIGIDFSSLPSHLLSRPLRISHFQGEGPLGDQVFKYMSLWKPFHI